MALIGTQYSLITQSKLTISDFSARCKYLYIDKLAPCTNLKHCDSKYLFV